MEGNQWLFDSVDVDGSRRVRSDSQVRKKWEGTAWGPHYGATTMYICTYVHYIIRTDTMYGLQHVLDCATSRLLHTVRARSTGDLSMYGTMQLNRIHM